jgi:thiosulfate dehydrogenase
LRESLQVRHRGISTSSGPPGKQENTLVKTFVVGLVLGLIAVPLALYLYLASGSAPVATSAAPMPFEKKLANKALHAVLEKEMPTSVPIPADEANFTAGAQVYRENCAVCHGLPGQPQTAIAKGMFPDPPMLLEGKGVTDDPAGETYWKVANGIRLSGMPGFKKSLSDTQMWQVSVLMAQADKISASVKQALAAPLPLANPAGSADPKKP